MATTTVLLRDVQGGNVPRICVKTGLPADVSGRFVFGSPSRLTWVTGTWGCAGLIVLALPLSLVLVPILALSAFVARHSRGVFALPMSQGARQRLWLGRWGTWILLPVSTGFLLLILYGSTRDADDLFVRVIQITLVVAAIIWVVAASWALLVTAAYLQPGGGVPLVGLQGLMRQDPTLGSYVELRGVHQHFADAVHSQYHSSD